MGLIFTVIFVELHVYCASRVIIIICNELFRDVHVVKLKYLLRYVVGLVLLLSAVVNKIGI